MIYVKKKNKKPDHHPQGLLVCEGSCSTEAAQKPTTHNLLSESWVREREEFVQVYFCSICKTTRRFGATQSRVTKGPVN